MEYFNTSEIYVLGTVNSNYKNLNNNIYSQHDPVCESHVIEYLDFITKVSTKNNSCAIILICAHGNMINGEYTIQFIGEHKLTIKSSLVSNKIRECKRKGLKCFVLIEACYSGNFDTSNFDVAITASDSDNQANHGILQQGLNLMLTKTSFSPMDLFKAVTDKNSRIVMTREVWTDHTSFTSQIFGLNQSNLLLHPNSLDELGKIKIKGDVVQFTNILNKNKYTSGEYSYHQVYSMMHKLYGNPIEV